MKIQIKKYLIQEGILSGVKDNWGKLLIGLGGVAAANAGVFGDSAQKEVQAGGSRLKHFMKDAGDWSQSAVKKLDDKYGIDANHDGKKTMFEQGQDKIENGVVSAKNKLDQITNNIENKEDNIDKIVKEVEDTN